MRGLNKVGSANFVEGDEILAIEKRYDQVVFLSLEMQVEIELIQDLEKISGWEQLDITMFVNLFRRIGLGSEGVL